MNQEDDRARFLFNLPEIYSSNTADWIIRNEFNPFLKHDDDESSGNHELPIINDEQQPSTSSRFFNGIFKNNDQKNFISFRRNKNKQNNGQNVLQPMRINDPRVMQANLNSIPQNVNTSSFNFNDDPSKSFPFEENPRLFQHNWGPMNRHNESSFKIDRMSPFFKTIIHIITICVLLFLLVWLIEPYQAESLDGHHSKNIDNNYSYFHGQQNELNDTVIKHETLNDNNIGIIYVNKAIFIIKSYYGKFLNLLLSMRPEKVQHPTVIRPSEKMDEKKFKNENHHISVEEIKSPDLVIDTISHDLDTIFKKLEELNFMKPAENMEE